ncbi:hypothetical protein F4560_000863 [Saccharothrix ecbatanensis]|uniref:Uncharacterized protein n=1 Tax=Saccharothrix ecbatanensis TaxID=1105145 RepID=A0A7W9HF57_9PSEU|nr:hypothetical protein [Saccharothrix ecbatanensis]MBB5801095.1 hypothetical protein [Saccharothrix ecbatanensis]
MKRVLRRSATAHPPKWVDCGRRYQPSHRERQALDDRAVVLPGGLDRPLDHQTLDEQVDSGLAAAHVAYQASVSSRGPCVLGREQLAWPYRTVHR